MEQELTQQKFAEQLNTDFQLHYVLPTGETGTIILKLTEVSELTRTGNTEAFSIILKGPAATPFAQGLCHLIHEVLGPLDLFLVPVGKTIEDYDYQAVFNRLIELPTTGI